MRCAWSSTVDDGAEVTVCTTGRCLHVPPVNHKPVCPIRAVGPGPATPRHGDVRLPMGSP